MEQYNILRVEGNTPTQSEEEDRKLFAYTRTAMEILGFTAEEVIDVFRVVAVVLKLGNLQFVPCNNIDGTEGCAIDNDYGKKCYLCLSAKKFNVIELSFGIFTFNVICFYRTV